MSTGALAPIVKWLDEAALAGIYSSSYWNDLEEERTKEWWIADGSTAAYSRLRSYLDAAGLMEEFRIVERFVAGLPQRDLQIADLAAGIGWTSSLFSRLPNVSTIHAVDISQHRLELLFPQALQMFAGNPTRVTRNLGSFYELGFADASMDIVFMSSSFHHAARPLRLLLEIDRVLRPGGRLILIGENYIGGVAILRRMARKLVTERRWVGNFYELFPPDHVLGDHYYRISDYFFFNQMLGYRMVQFSVQNRQSALFISEKAGG